METKKKSLALKSQEEEDSKSENETNLSDGIVLWSRRIARMIKKRGKSKKGKISQKESSKSKTSNKDDVTCFGCNKQEHFKSECPELKKDVKKKKKKCEHYILSSL